MLALDQPRTRAVSSVDRNLLSKKPIASKERLIFALDVPTHAEAKDLVVRFGDAINFYKLGLELWMSGDYFRLVDWLRGQGKQVFVDLKFFDVPETVSRAVGQLRNVGAKFATVHPTSDDLLRAVVAEKGELSILAVTVLTSLSQSDLDDLGFKCTVEELVLSRARRSIDLGCDGVISSGLEVQKLRNELGERFLIVSPGIRPLENKLADDQKRVVTPEEAFKSGADYIVVGRPIRTARDPVAKAWEIQESIDRIFAS